MYKGYLRPLEFPWTKIYSTIEYDVNFLPGEKIAIDCQQEKIKQKFEGPKILIDAISSLKYGIFVAIKSLHIFVTHCCFYSSSKIQVFCIVLDCLLPSCT